MDAAKQQERPQRRTEIGVVTSDSMQKTIAVAADRLVRHPKYGKYLRRTTIYKAHDEKGEAKLGDRVEIVMSRPLSRTKRWRLVRVVEKARGDQIAVGVQEQP
jgi:small subunit ribosomal protein S17